MKGKSVVIETLNSLLSDELIAIDQYMVHAEMFANWGYEKLAEVTEKRAITEMKHAEKLQKMKDEAAMRRERLKASTARKNKVSGEK